MIIGFFAMAGETRETRFSREAQFNNNASGNVAGDTYSASDTQQLMNQYEALFGPAGRDIKVDSQRNKRHQRWHLPDSIKGYNSFLTDRIDGLITDATNSPFTRNILPYFYLENPDAKIKWNVYSFDEGMASRVPYESAARVLTQTKSSQSGYAIRQGLAIAMEHNFLASEAGRTNFKHQLTQLVGSIQLTNDLDVHIALLQAQSYEKIISEKYYGTERTLARTGKQYCEMFGIYNKIPNALDLLIEEARTKLKTWGSEPPTFLLCPSNLTLHLTMSPERTNYITNGPDGLKRLAQGPDLPSYRGLQIIHSQKFALEAGREPRNVLRRKVRVAEYYWLPHDPVKTADCVYEFYDQSSDSFKNFTKAELIRKSGVEAWMKQNWNDEHVDVLRNMPNAAMTEFDFKKCDVLVLRPNIEHEMLSVIMGRGGTQELGSTFWGQTELACYDDAQHGIWGMSYKYHERAIVTNERNLVRIFDVAFDGYNGGMGCDIMQWTPEGIAEFRRDTESLDGPYRGKSMLVLAFPTVRIKDAYQTLRITKAPADEQPPGGQNGNDDEGGPELQIINAENPAHDNERLDLERVLRKLTTANPPHWTHTEPLLETLLSECKEAFEKLSVFMHLFVRRQAGAQAVDYDEWAAYVNNAGGVDGPLPYKEIEITTARQFQDAISNEIANLHLGPMSFTVRKDLFVYILLKVITGFLAQSSYSALSMESTPFRLLHTEMDSCCYPDEIDGHVPQVNMGRLANAIRYVRILTNIDCESLLIALWHSKDARYFNWLEYFYGLNNDMNNMWIAAEIPNPLILPTMFMSESASPGQVFVDSESTIPISDHSKYDLARFLTENMTRNVFTKQRDVEGIYSKYATHLESLFNSQVNIQPGENIRSNTTQIPTLCYHGNMKVRQAAYVTQDIKCTGHMGNSYPGMASVREGRGVQSMTMPAQIMHLQ